jgi:hypothetical protein
VKAGLATGAEVPAHPPRPSDLYYAKVMAGLKVERRTGVLLLLGRGEVLVAVERADMGAVFGTLISGFCS